MVSMKLCIAFFLLAGLVYAQAKPPSPALPDGPVTDVSSILPKLQDGDMVFIQSEDGYAELISSLTGSTLTHCGMLFHEGKRWLVYEGAGLNSASVHRTLQEWQRVEHPSAHGKQPFYIRRLNDAATLLTPDKLRALKTEAARLHNTPYDHGFAWDNHEKKGDKKEYIYCSELIYKAYERALGSRIGKVHPIKDYFDKMSRAQKERVNAMLASPPCSTCLWEHGFRLGEPIVSPQDVFESPLLVSVRPDSRS